MATPFTPPRLPPEGLDWKSLLPLLGPAHAAAGRFDALLKNLPDAKLLLSPLATNEAVMSSRIEGIQASLEDVMEFQAGQTTDDHRRDDIREVINYLKAMDFAFDALRSDTMALSGCLFKGAHEILMSGERGADKSPGQFREAQVFIGASPNIEEAAYIPPEASLIPELIANLEDYIRGEAPDVLVQLAIVHAQFELIHPFLDGNGRIGRLIMPFFLYGKGAIHAPHFHISEYIERHRSEYYDCLKKISSEGNLEGWIKFFLRAVTEQSHINAEKALAVVDLKKDTALRAEKATRSKYVPQIADYLCSTPIFEAVHFRDTADVPASSAIRLLNQLERAEVVKKTATGKGRRSSAYAFSDLMQIIGR